MRTLHKHTKAFTMIELVFVIVVLGILAAVSLPRMDRDIRQEAADNILSAIRYAQHLALNDDKTDPFDGTWQSNLWKISFLTASGYSISSGSNFAVDPNDGKVMDDGNTNASPNIFIGKKYGVTTVTSSGCGSVIAFDNLGRPFDGVSATNDYSNYMSSDCNLTFSAANAFPGEPIIITISRETGHAFIVNQETL